MRSDCRRPHQKGGGPAKSIGQLMIMSKWRLGEAAMPADDHIKRAAARPRRSAG